MKRIIVSALLLLVAFSAFSQEADEKVLVSPSLVIAPNLIGPIIGIYGGVVNFKASETVTIDTDSFYFNIRNIPFVEAGLDPDTQFWTGGIKVGPTVYLDQAFHGLHVGAYLKGAYFVIGDSTNQLNSMALGGGLKAGWTGTFDWFSMTLAGGYEYTKSITEITTSSAELDAYSASIEGGSPFFSLIMGFAVY